MFHLNITVTSFYSPPVDLIGAGVQMHMLANAYVRLGHTVTLLTPAHLVPDDALYSHAHYPVVGRNRVLKWSIALARCRFSSGIVHFAGDNHFVSKQIGTFRLRTFHGSCFAEAKSAVTRHDKLRMMYLGVTELLGQMRSDCSTVVSADTNKYFPSPNVVIPNGVDLSAFSPSLNSKSPNPSILFVGMLDSRKRGKKLLEQFTKFVRVKIPNAELWVVRDSQPIDVPGVKVFGHVSQDLLVELYQSAWCFCLPSLYEGFGVPYIESMACGTPVVTTPNPGGLEVTENGKYGVVSDIDRIGEELVSLLDNPTKRLELANSALGYVQRFEINAIAQRYINLSIGVR
jgi:phosphatidylinositol alpha-mannosyltransferase